MSQSTLQRPAVCTSNARDADRIVPPWCDPSDTPAIRWAFDDLKASYNFPHPSERRELFVGLVAEEARYQRRLRENTDQRSIAPCRALDIGCGEGIGLLPEATISVSHCFDEVWGLEPDPSVTPAPGAFAKVLNCELESANLPANHFDVAYSFMVMEHVSDPARFMHTLAAALKPGGSYIFTTVNGLHYFALLADTLRRLKLDEAVLRLVRGRQAVDEYHYPTQYRCNTPRQVRRACRAAGLSDPECVFVERAGRIPYLPGPLDVFRRLLEAKRRVHRNPRSLLDFICRIRKPL